MERKFEVGDRVSFDWEEERELAKLWKQKQVFLVVPY